MLHQKHVASKHVASKCLWSNWVARNPPLVALHCQQHCVQHAIFCHTSKSILDTQRFRRLLCIQPCVWVETLEKVFRTKQPTLHAISSLFPLSPEPCGSESRCVLGGTPFWLGAPSCAVWSRWSFRDWGCVLDADGWCLVFAVRSSQVPRSDRI